MPSIPQPFATYNGGKSGNGTYQTIINHIPKTDVFIDCMVGNGGIVSKLKLPSLTVINDIDAKVIAQYNCVDHGESLKIENLCYRSIIDKYANAGAKVFFYFDPPYLFSTRRSQNKLYRFEWTDEQHKEFLSLILTVPNNCMISHYPCPLYDEMLSGWETHDFQSMTRNGLRTERIYMNYPKPLILQDFRYVGADYIERQRIKRKITALLKKLDNLPGAEKTAILSSIIEKYNDASAALIQPAVQSLLTV